MSDSPESADTKAAQPQDPSEQPSPATAAADSQARATPEDFEDDPAREPEDQTLKDIKGG